MRGFLSLVLLSLAMQTAQGQYAIDWFTVDGGGGTSTGGIYSATGTIGQPDAGTMSGGQFTLVGGFWGIVAAIQTQGAPWLSAWRSDTNTVVVFWSAAATGWQLHATTDMAGGTWTEIPPPYHTVSTNLFYTEQAPTGNKFYRLHQP